MRRIRIAIFMIVTTLICIGVVMIYSSSAIFAYDKYDSTTFFFKRHLVHLLIGAVLAIWMMSLDVRKLRRWAKPVFILGLVLLGLVFVPFLGREVGGAKRWLAIGTFSFQPSEFTKFAVILLLAQILSQNPEDKRVSRKRFALAIFFAGITCALILVQPDLGSALSVVAVTVVLLFVAGLRFIYIASAGILSLPALWFLVFDVPYRRKRIMAFLDPWADVKGYGFQIIQSYLALGLGGFWGVGLGQSRQKLFYLPAAHTDFIFSIIGEELGLIGTSAITILFLLFLWQGMKIAFRSTDPFIKLLSAGIVTSITLSACVHIAVVCGAAPTKGLPLPFISYGGSSLVFNMMAVGLLLNCARERYFQEQKL